MARCDLNLSRELLCVQDALHGVSNRLNDGRNSELADIERLLREAAYKLTAIERRRTNER